VLAKIVATSLSQTAIKLKLVAGYLISHLLEGADVVSRV